MRDVIYTIRGAKTWTEMTWQELAEALEQTKCVLVPIGSTEQHGPHIPMFTDTMQGLEICQRVKAQLAAKGKHVIIGPAIPFGPTAQMMSFPGTCHISSSTLKAIMRDMTRSMHRHGVRKLVFVLGHGGNWPTMMEAAQELGEEFPDMQIGSLNWLPELKQHYPRILTGGPTEGHAGEGETARGLVTHPELVQLERIKEILPQPAAAGPRIEADEPPLYGGAYLRPNASFRDVAPQGFKGNPRLATREKGEQIYQVMADWVAAVVERDFLEG